MEICASRRETAKRQREIGERKFGRRTVGVATMEIFCGRKKNVERERVRREKREYNVFLLVDIYRNDMYIKTIL